MIGWTSHTCSVWTLCKNGDCWLANYFRVFEMSSILRVVGLQLLNLAALLVLTCSFSWWVFISLIVCIRSILGDCPAVGLDHLVIWQRSPRPKVLCLLCSTICDINISFGSQVVVLYIVADWSSWEEVFSNGIAPCSLLQSLKESYFISCLLNYCHLFSFRNFWAQKTPT